jgi:hypothetical protein
MVRPRLSPDLIFLIGVTGRLRVSREGFNGTLTGPHTTTRHRHPSQSSGPYDGIRGFTRDMRNYPGGFFQDMKDDDDFKYTDNLPTGQASRPQCWLAL